MIACCSVFNVCPETTLLLPVWPRDAKRLDTPGLEIINIVKLRDQDFKGGQDDLNLELVEKASCRQSSFLLISKMGSIVTTKKRS